MLDGGLQLTMIEKAWSELGCRVVLPKELAHDFEKQGPIQTEYHDRRQFRRFHFRRRALLERRDELLCVYTKDISRAGVVILHAEQIFPCEHVVLFLLNGQTLQAKVRRCRRLNASCYECGLRIVATSGSG